MPAWRPLDFGQLPRGTLPIDPPPDPTGTSLVAVQANNGLLVFILAVSVLGGGGGVAYLRAHRRRRRRALNERNAQNTFLILSI